jgi:acylphosphatase
MNIQIFKTTEEANAFIPTIELAEQGGVQVLPDGEIAVFFNGTKETYKERFLTRMIEGLENNLFHEEIRLASATAEVETRKDKGTNLKGFDASLEKQKEAQLNIDIFKAKIQALQAWKESNS